jgi:hypothetical protein
MDAVLVPTAGVMVILAVDAPAFPGPLFLILRLASADSEHCVEHVSTSPPEQVVLALLLTWALNEVTYRSGREQ